MNGARERMSNGELRTARVEWRMLCGQLRIVEGEVRSDGDALRMNRRSARTEFVPLRTGDVPMRMGGGEFLTREEGNSIADIYVFLSESLRRG